MPPSLSPTALVAILQPWSDVAEPIHRRLAQLADAGAGQDVLWVGCGGGRSVLWWAGRFRTHVEGVDPDHAAIEAAERTTRAAGLAGLATFQTAAPTNLPHEARVFDVIVVDLLHLLGPQGAAILGEAARVARPMSTLMALVLSWVGTPQPAEAQLIAALGLDPHLLVEWKSFCRDAGIVELTVEDAALDGGWIAPGWPGLLVRGWRAARWAGVRAVVSREFRALRHLALRRVVNLSIIKGTRWPHEREERARG